MYYWNGFRQVFKNLDLLILELVHKKKEIVIVTVFGYLISINLYQKILRYAWYFQFSFFRVLKCVPTRFFTFDILLQPLT